MNDILKEQSQFFEYVENSIIQYKKLSHAYLIETNGYIDYQFVINEFIKKILTLDISDKNLIKKIAMQVDNHEYPDITYIEPDGFYIKKEQLLTLENQYFKKSMLDNKLIYVIDPAEQLNSSSANTILKFLEEPPEGIIAILICSNRYNVLETIVSRCQILSLINIKKEDYSEKIVEFCQEIDNPKKIFIKYDYYLENLFSDKNIARENLKLIEDFLFHQGKIKLDEKQFNKISNQVQLIENEIEILQYNVNMKIWLSSFIFKLMEVV